MNACYNITYIQFLEKFFLRSCPFLIIRGKPDSISRGRSRRPVRRFCFFHFPIPPERHSDPPITAYHIKCNRSATQNCQSPESMQTERNTGSISRIRIRYIPHERGHFILTDPEIGFRDPVTEENIHRTAEIHHGLPRCFERGPGSRSKKQSRIHQKTDPGLYFRDPGKNAEDHA